MQYANSDTYEGSWIAGQRRGYGKYVSTSGVIYEGTWQADHRHGYGRELRPTGVEFSGQWRKDQRQGKGVETHADGTRHSGLWSANKIFGLGTRISRAGVKLHGHWLNNTLTQGSLNLPDGSTYTGMLFNDSGRKVTPQLVVWLKGQAADKNAYAQLFLGHAFLDFDAPKPDFTTARIWLKQAANTGIAEAQYRLATLEVIDNAADAITLLKQAAAQAHPIAHELLGSYYHAGQYVEQDIETAIEHYEVAIEHGSIRAINNLAWLLGTTQAKKYSNPTRAIELIQPLVLYRGHWQYLDTLAAAHARLGDMQRAVRLEHQAIIQAQSRASELEVDDMSQRLILYEADKPYVE